MKLHDLKAPANRKTRKRLGRGQGSGKGEQSGRGHNGQNSRSGSSVKPWFEGGQMPLQRRIPKFGFKNRFRTSYKPLNLDRIQECLDAGRITSPIILQDLVSAGLVGKNDLVKLLGGGELTEKIEIEVHACSQSARKQIEAAGGTITELK